jgi:hypothetical protein
MAALDYYCRPGLAEASGAFNGQRARRQLYLELAKVCRFQAIVETGTFRGHTTAFLASGAAAPVYTVEAFPRYHYFARRRFRNRSDIHLISGDSRAFLEQLARDEALRAKRIFFYLDAHWYDDLPLRREVELIAATWKELVVMIDDFAVPGDDGYGFDDYGQGRRLSLEYLPPLDELGWAAFFPTTPSAEETGWRRGCVVLTRGQMAERLSGLRLLRRHGQEPCADRAKES